MNTTLTTIAVALVLALAAALIGPHFVDWTLYRAEFEARASALAGAPVHVKGDVDARLLPNPSIRFRDVVIGRTGEAARLEVREFALRLSPAPLLRGDVHVRDVEVTGPRLTLEIGPDGEVAAPLEIPSDGVDPSRVTLDRMEIVDGVIVVSDPELGRRIEISGVGGTGSAGSLIGPFRFDGAASHDGEAYSVRFATGRFGVGGTQARLDVSDAESGRALTLDGMVSFDALKPSYEGRAALARVPPKGSASGDGWSLSGTAKADPRQVRFDDLTVQYGPDDRALRLEGFADLDVGLRPLAHFDLAARQLDIDRLLGSSKTPRRPEQALAQLWERLPGLSPGLPLSVDLKVDGVLIGQNLVQDVRVSAAVEDGGVRIEAARATFPGMARAALVGRVALDAQSTRFDGAVEADLRDLPLLLRWLGREEAAPSGARRVAFSGDVGASPDRIALTNAEVTVDGETAKGSLAWQRGGQGASLTARVIAERLDLDALAAGALLREHAVADFDLKLDVGVVRYLGLEAHDVGVDLSVQQQAWSVRRFRLGDLAGAEVYLSGDLSVQGKRVAGALDGKIKATSIEGLARLLADSPVPGWMSQGVLRRARALSPMDTTLTFGVEEETSGDVAMTLDGMAGGSLLGLRISADRLGMDAAFDADLEMTAEDSNSLTALLDLPVMAVEKAGEGRLKVSAQGTLAERVATDVSLSLHGGSLEASGDLKIAKDGITGSMDLSLASEDIAPLMASLGRLPLFSLDVLPVQARARMVLSSDAVKLDALKAAVSGYEMTGRLALSGADWRRLDGTLSFGRLGLGHAVMLALGPSSLGDNAASGWPRGPVAPGLFQGFRGRVGVIIGESDLGDGLPSIRDVTAQADIVPGGLNFEAIEGSFAGGRLAGSLGMRGLDGKVALRTGISLTDADLSALVWLRLDGTPVLEGRGGLTLDVTGSGATIAAAIRSLSGGGTVTGQDIVVKDLDPRAFSEVRTAAVKGLELTPAKVSEQFETALNGADLEVREASGAFSVASGVLRLSNLVMTSDSAGPMATVTVNLGEKTIAAAVGLSPLRMEGVDASALPRATLHFEGPIADPARRLDVTPLTGFLTAEAIEREMKRIEQLEADAQERGRLRREQEAEAKRRRAEALARQAAARKAEEQRLGKERKLTMPPLGPPIEVGPPPGAQTTPATPAVPSYKATGSVRPQRPGAPLVITPQQLP